MIVMGVDPGLADLGWGVLEFLRGEPYYVAHGCVKTEPGTPDWDRVRTLVGTVQGLVVRHKVQALGMEEWVFFKKQVTTAAHSLGLVMGGILCSSSVPIVSGGRSQDWRLSLGLSATSTKAEVQRFVQRRLGMATLPTPQHASDALAIAMAAYPKL